MNDPRLLLVFFMGDGLAWLVYGEAAGRAAHPCTGIDPIVLVLAALGVLSWAARKTRGERARFLP